jgi:hypothetical protein
MCPGGTGKNNLDLQSARATVSRFWSDQQEGLSSESEDYVFGCLEISSEHEGV